VTTVLPHPHEPISKAKLLDKMKTPKTAEELKKMEDDEKAQAAKDEAEGKKPKKDKKKKKGGAENDDHLFNFSDIPLADQIVDYKKDMFGKPAFLSVSG
jgi:hypothetical protein